jgi:hypothetical protein
LFDSPNAFPIPRAFSRITGLASSIMPRTDSLPEKFVSIRVHSWFNPAP